MPTPTAAQLADAVTAAMNAADWSVEFTATRETVPIQDRDQMGSATYVKVAPVGLTATTISRAKTERTIEVDVAVLKAMDNFANATVDPLAALVEAIGEFWLRTPLASPAATCVEISVPSLCMPESARELLFVGAITLTFKLYT